MRLTLEIAGLIGVCATLVVVLVAALGLRRDLRIVEEDIARDARMVALAVAVSQGAATREEVVRELERVDEALPELRIGWTEEDRTGRSDEAVIASAPLGDGFVTVEESLAPRDDLYATQTRDVFVMSLLVLLAVLGIGGVLGRTLVGRRVDALVHKARQVAQGEFDQPVAIGGVDELEMLAEELNRMAGQLKSARQQANREAEARLEVEVQLRHADRLRMVGQLAAGLAHELGTPLNVVAGRAQLLLRRLHDERDRADLGTIREQVERISGLVRSLMAFAGQRGRSEDDLEIDTVLERTMQLVGPAVGRTKISVRGGGARLRGDVEQLTQVFVNLVMNAAQAGAGEVRLTVSGPPLVVDVDDDGPGIPPDLVDRVAEPFFTTKGPGEGTGLGLSVAEQIIEDHGASMQVLPSPLGGARLRVAWRA